MNILKSKSHKIFTSSIFFKGLHGALEFVSGLFLFFTQRNIIVSFSKKFFSYELFEDPTDLIANFVINLAQGVTATTLKYSALYMIFAGLVDLLLFIGLIKKKLWVYPLATIIISTFVLYQSIRFYFTHSAMLAFLTILDILILVLLKIEYKHLS